MTPGLSVNIQTIKMYLSLLLVVSVVSLMCSSSSSVSTSLYRAVRVMSDSLTFLPVLDEVVRSEVTECGLSCSSQDCPAFSYSQDTGLCSRLAVSSNNYTSWVYISDRVRDDGENAYITIAVKKIEEDNLEMGSFIKS